MSESCPKCGMAQTGKIDEGYRHFDCFSFAHESGSCFQQSKQCTALAAATKRAEEAEAKIVSMRAGCDSTIENYRKQEHELVKQIAEFERTVAGCRALIATLRTKLANAEQENARLREVLAWVEWFEHHESRVDLKCPFCFAYQYEGHESDCRLVAPRSPSRKEKQ